MPSYVCVTCGTHYDPAPTPPDDCVICTEERQYVGWQGQRWSTSDQLHAEGRVRIQPEDEGLTGIGTEPPFAIGQRALHFRSSAGGVLWDCIGLIDQDAVAAVGDLGGVKVMAISHPHFYGAMVEWSHALGRVPVYLNARDRAWVMRDDPVIRYWDGDALEIAPGVTLVRCGGHFEGSTVLHWAGGAGGLGALLSGDTIMVNQDRRTVSFMYSYPNLIPLGAEAVRRIAAAVEPFEFERIYGGWFGKNVLEAGKRAMHYSTRRYLHAIGQRAQG